MDDEPKCGMTIKGVPVATRQTVTALAANDRTSIAELLTGMVRREKAARATEHAREGKDAIEPSAGGVVSPAGTQADDDADARLIRLLGAAAALSEACGGKLAAVPGLTALCAERVRDAADCRRWSHAGARSRRRSPSRSRHASPHRLPST